MLLKIGKNTYILIFKGFIMRVLKIAGLVLMLSCFLSTYASADISTSLVAHYPLDNTPYDVSGNDFDGTIFGALIATTDRLGSPDGALIFGSPAFIRTVPSSEMFANYDGVTLSAWIKTTNHTINDTWYRGPIWNCWYDNSSNQVMLSVQGGRAMLTITSGGANVYEHLQGTSFISDGLWHHVVVVFDDLNDFGRIYTDGYLDNEGPLFLSPTPTSQKYLIGRNGYGNVYFEGVIDELRIYNRAMLESDVLELFLTEEFINLEVPLNDKIDDILDDPDIPDEAADPLEDAIKDLYGKNESQSGAVDKLASGDLVSCLTKMKKALSDLIDAATLGADTLELQQSVVSAARAVAMIGIQDAASVLGFDHPDVVDAMAFVDEGDLLAADGYFIEAVGFYKRSLQILNF